MKRILCIVLLVLSCSSLLIGRDCTQTISSVITDDVKPNKLKDGITIDKSYCKVLSVKQDGEQGIARVIISFKNASNTPKEAITDVTLLYEGGRAQASTSELVLPAGGGMSRSKIIRIPLDVKAFDVMIELKDCDGTLLETYTFTYPASGQKPAKP